jgi:hypothetical protein
MGTLPFTSLEEVVSSIEEILWQELTVTGVVDLEAMWNPLKDETVPTVSIVEEDNACDSEKGQTDSAMSDTKRQPFRVQAAEILLSPFGRPTGWKVKLANPSMVNALLSRGKSKEGVRVGWKLVQVKEYHPKDDKEVDFMLVDDTLVRFENCPPSLDVESLRYLLSRYDLAPTGDTIVQWKGRTNDGKVPQPMFLVRFASPAWARAAVREMQNMHLDGKSVKLIQYPRQMLVNENTNE